jgi:anti-anti-sigma factor
MEILDFYENDICRIVPVGRIDTVSASEFQNQTIALMADKNKCAIDFSKVNYISSAGLRSILLITKEISKKKGNLVIFAMSESIKEIFVMSGFSSIIKIVNSMEDVISEFNK